MNTAQLYSAGVDPRFTQKTQEQDEEIQRKIEERSIAQAERVKWLENPYTKAFLAHCKQRELKLMEAARDTAANHSASDGLVRNLIRSRTYREVIDYATTGIAD